MRVYPILRWGILASCFIASALNILHLAGLLSQHAATYGFLLLVACLAALLLIKKRHPDAPAARDTGLERARGILTALFAVVWLVTAGMIFAWNR